TIRRKGCIMLKEQAEISIKNLREEASSLSPSSLITLFEIDISDIAEERGIILSEDDKYFRFHNNVKLVNTEIKFQNKIYFLSPINATEFEVKSQGVLPRPRLSIFINDRAVELFAILKERIRLLGDLVGAKVTRKRTFAAFLDKDNFNSDNM